VLCPVLCVDPPDPISGIPTTALGQARRW
jgi:hypothetical protein